MRSEGTRGTKQSVTLEGGSTDDTKVKEGGAEDKNNHAKNFRKMRTSGTLSTLAECSAIPRSYFRAFRRRISGDDNLE